MAYSPLWHHKISHLKGQTTHPTSNFTDAGVVISAKEDLKNSARRRSRAFYWRFRMNYMGFDRFYKGWLWESYASYMGFKWEFIGFHTHLRYVKISIWGLVPENQGKITTCDAFFWGIPHFETDPCENPNPYIPFWKAWGEWGYGSWWGLLQSHDRTAPLDWKRDPQIAGWCFFMENPFCKWMV